ncbi:MAG: BLUF domain-containing protein [Planctomycetota bacterium]
MPLHHLLYISHADHLLSPYQVGEMLEPFRRRNRALGITGVLFYSAGHFVQLLEGEADEVHNLFGTIRRDDRHEDVRQLLSFPVGQRLFDDWSMALLNVDCRTTLEETCLVQLVREAEAAEVTRAHTAMSWRLLVQFRDLLRSPNTPSALA